MLERSLATAARPATLDAAFSSRSNLFRQPKRSFGTTLCRLYPGGLAAPARCMANEGSKAGRQQLQQPSRANTVAQATKSRGHGLWAINHGLEAGSWHSVPPSTSGRLLLSGLLVAVSTALVARQAMLQLLSGLPAAVSPVAGTVVWAIATAWDAYCVQLDVHPIATKLCTSLVGCFIGDLIAQVLTHALAAQSYKKRYEHAHAHVHSHSQSMSSWDHAEPGHTHIHGDALATSSHEHVHATPQQQQLLNAWDAATLPPPPQFHYDTGRVTRLMLYSILTAPWYQFWFLLLDQIIMPGAPLAPQAVAMKVAADQLIMAPILTAFFFVTMRMMEDVMGGLPPAAGRPTFKTLLDRGVESAKSKLIPTMKANYAVWPLAHVINFALIPPPQRILYCTAVSIAWTAFVCCMLSKSSQEEAQAEGTTDKPTGEARGAADADGVTAKSA